MIRFIAKTIQQQPSIVSSKLSSLPHHLKSKVFITPEKNFQNISLSSSVQRFFSNKKLKLSTEETEEETQRKKNAQKNAYIFQPKFMKVSQETSDQNCQNFFMKVMELLPEAAIPDLIKRIESFKAKFLAAMGRSTSVDETAFLNSCEKFFDKHNAMELMQYLVRIKPIDLKATYLSGTIFGFDSQIDLQTKIDKFYTFSSQTSPASLYKNHESEADETDTLEEINKKPSDYDVLSKTSGINFSQHTAKKIAVKKSLEFSEDMQVPPIEGLEGTEYINEFAGLEGIPGLGGLGENKMIMNEGQEDEIDGEDFSSFMPNQRRNVSQAELDISQAINEASAALLRENGSTSDKRKDYLRIKFASENMMLYQTQGKDEVVYATQMGFEKRHITPSNFVYLYGLPYEIEDEAAMKEMITKHFSNDVGKIKNIELFSFKNYLDISAQERNVQMFPNLDAVFDPMAQAINKLGMGELSNTENHFDYAETAAPALKKNLSESEQTTINSKIRTTKRILSSIKEKSNQRLDKSYALIELESAEIKKKALSPDLRIFGIYIDKRMCMIDDADHKLTISCNNVHWGSTLKSFVNHVNQVFEEQNLLDLRIEIPSKFENKILTKFYVLLRFNNLRNTLRAMQALNNTVFEKRAIKVNHLYGSLKLTKGEYHETLDVDSMAIKTERIYESKIKEANRISLLSREDDTFNELSDPLAKIGHLQTYEESQDMEKDNMRNLYKIKKIDETNEEKWYQSTSDSEKEDEMYGAESVEGLALAGEYKH